MQISIIIPTLNEEKYIKKCINSVLDFELPSNIKTEIFIVDGNSTDKTVEIVNELHKKNDNFILLNNPKKIQATALNIAIRKCHGEYILRLDAHSFYPRNYIQLLWETSQRTNADNVGGLFITQPGGNNYQALLVQALTTHPFGVGNSGFRIGMKEGKADTVPYGFYKKSVFDDIGYLDERLVRAQDYEFNRRIILNGGIIWRDPAIHVYYYNQPTLFKFLRKQFLLEAPYNAYMWYLAPYTFAYRHAITGVFALGIILGIILTFSSPIIKYIFIFVLILYAILAIISSFQQAIRYRKLRHFFLLPVSFFLYHFIHGLGVLKGIVLLIFHRSPVQKICEPWKGAGRFRVRYHKKK